jgi:hypothetical protein
MYSQQVKRQYSTPVYSEKRPLEFGLFQDALQSFSPTRCQELEDRLVEKSIRHIQA